jgi:hypothetical protein
LGPKLENQLNREEEHNPVSSHRTKLKATKAWAGYCRADLGQFRPKTTLIIHLDQRPGAFLGGSKLATHRARPKTLARNPISHLPKCTRDRERVEVTTSIDSLAELKTAASGLKLLQRCPRVRSLGHALTRE